MTWKRVNFVLQWGPAAGALAVAPRRHPDGHYTVHLPPGAPVWVHAKASRLVREWLRPAGVSTRRRVRWATFGATGRPGRWARGAHLRGRAWAGTTRAVRGLVRSGGYDFTRWGRPVRGVTLLEAPWGVALHGEVQVVRPRYV